MVLEIATIFTKNIYIVSKEIKQLWDAVLDTYCIGKILKTF